MRLHRRGQHIPKNEALSVDQVMCKLLPRGHLNVAKTFLCFHDMFITVPFITVPGWMDDGPQILSVIVGD